MTVVPILYRRGRPSGTSIRWTAGSDRFKLMNVGDRLAGKMVFCACAKSARERSAVRQLLARSAWLLPCVFASAALIGVVLPAAAQQFTPHTQDPSHILEGNWQSCREADGTYAERVYDGRWTGLSPFELHMGPYHEFALFRGIQDDYIRARGLDYFDNSRRAAYVQQAYAIRNPKKFAGYGKYAWGITASDGPGPARRKIKGITREFYDYVARSIPNGPDDGTLAPWAVVASLPFAPELVLPSIKHFNEAYPEMTSEYGFKCSYNPTFSGGKNNLTTGWISQGYYGLDQGPIVMMIENYRTGFLWRLMRQSPAIQMGLRRAGFTGGWLQE